MGSSVLMRAGKMPGLEAAPAIPTMDWLGPLGRMAGLMEPRPPSARLLTLVTLPLMLHPASTQSQISPADLGVIVLVVITWLQCGRG